MPEFCICFGSDQAYRDYRKLDEFAQAYVEAMFFTDASCGDDGDLEHATVADLAPETWDRLWKDCAAFEFAANEWLQKAYGRKTNTGHIYSEARAGHDFWLTRNGHGAGFWDRGLGAVGDRLSELCGHGTHFSTLDLYRGDDGLIYFG